MQTRTLLLTLGLFFALTAPPLHAQASPTTPDSTTTDQAAKAPKAKAVMLRYQFTPGQTRAYQIAEDVDGTATGPQGPLKPFKQHTDAVLRQTVQSVSPSGVATLQVALEGVKMTLNGSPVPAQEGAAQQHFTIVMAPNGQIVSVQTAAGPVRQDSDLRGIFQSLTDGPLPDRPVKPGDTWNGPGGLAAIGFKTTTVNTLRAVDANTARITAKMDGTIDSGSTPVPPPMTASGTLTGTSAQTLDVGTGILQSLSGTTTMTLTLTPKPAHTPVPGTPAPVGMTATMKITTQMDLLPVVPKPARR